MKLKSFAAAILLGIGLFSAGANAAYVQLVPAPQANDGSINLPPAGFTATYSPTADVASIWFNGNVSPQSPANVAASITGQFGGTLTLAGQDDNYNSGSISLPGNPFDVLAIHLGGAGGGNELLFFFNTAITEFDVTTFDQGGGNNLSNFRAYTTSPVPLPAAAWLFGSALIGLAGIKRRKS
jgi:hypothetical protein